MTLLRTFTRPPCRVTSSHLHGSSHLAARSYIHIITKPCHRLHPNHARPPSSTPSPSYPHRRQATFFFTSTLNPRFYSSHGSRSRPQASHTSGYKSGFLVIITAIVLAWQAKDQIIWRPVLNTTTFVPYTVTSREQVSPTAFILTATPTDSLPWTGALSVLNYILPRYRGESLVEEIWRTGATWSVEVKQPQLQVARDYTPLPPPPDRDEGGRDRLSGVSPRDGNELRFLIRRMEGGEVSSYLSGLKVGDRIELRGPHYGFDVRRRLGDGDRVVFLAGGTGIAPALQAVKAVLEGPNGAKPRMEILWANRQRADCIGCPGLKDRDEGLNDRGGPILDQLADIQRKYPGRVTVRCAVDEERNFVQMGALAGLVTSTARKTKPVVPAKHCWLHSQDAVAWLPAADMDAEKKEDVRADNCQCASGRNLLFVSGPDGFIEHFAGAKRWANGMELQGSVGGVLGKIRAKYPDAMKDWLVLKL